MWDEALYGGFKYTERHFKQLLKRLLLARFKKRLDIYMDKKNIKRDGSSC